jgi:hypothetical protein
LQLLGSYTELFVIGQGCWSVVVEVESAFCEVVVPDPER